MNPAILAFAGRANGQVLCGANNTGGLSRAQSIIFPVTANGQYHTYELDLAATGQWSGLITNCDSTPPSTASRAITWT